MITVRVTEDDAGMRLDALLAREARVTRAVAAELVSGGAVTVDGRPEPKAYRVQPGEVVEAAPPEEAERTVEVPDVRLVFEDDDLMVVDKDAGVVVHPAPGLREGTIVDALARSGRPLAPAAGEDRPGVVHRLDRDVSGLLLVAKTDRAHGSLTSQIAARDARREYLALVAGSPHVDTGKIEAPIGRHTRHRGRMAVLPDGKPSVTWFRVRERLGPATLLEVRLETGRTHQIRTHMESIGHPVVGDPSYGHDPALARSLGLRRPFLHAYRLTVDHPVTGERMTFRSDLPHDLRSALDMLRAS